MITFKAFKSGIYLPEADINDPGNARVGFMFQVQRNDNTFTLSEQTYTDPNLQGYFAFFVPSGTRDWDKFATQARRQFQMQATAQFGWFSESGGNIVASTIIAVANQGTSNPSLGAALILAFKNVSFQMEPSNLPLPAISFDDDKNCFLITNPLYDGKPAARIVVKPPNSPSQTYYSNSQNVVLSMEGQQAASLNADFQFDIEALAQFESGFMYFAASAESASSFTPLNYPLLRATGGASTPLNFSAWLDLLEPLTDTRTFFQLTDTQVGSYFVSATGHTFDLLTVNDSDLTNTSRLVFANRPILNTNDTKAYYLTPAGKFQITTDTNGSAPPSSNENQWMLCGMTGTEFLSLNVAANSTEQDTLFFQPGQPAYKPTQSNNGASGNNPQYLDSLNGKVTTSWVQFISTDGSYISQPEQSPLYQQSQSSPASVKGEASSSGLSVYVMDFLDLPTWSASTSTASPTIPMVPYSGIPSVTDLDPYRVMESTALNPTRKNAFTNAQPSAKLSAEAATDDVTFAMTPQGLLAGLTGSSSVWTDLQMATSPAGILQFSEMGTAIRQSLQQNQIFLVISTTKQQGVPLFNFINSSLEIAGWPFDLSPDGTKDNEGNPPILILKFYPGQSIADLVDNIDLWSQPDTFNDPSAYSASKAQAYIQQMIQNACESVYGEGNCTDGNPTNAEKPDTSSLYYNFYEVVTDPEFSGIMAVNCNMQLTELPLAIRAVLGGMTKDGPDGPVSNVDAFRVHHVGVQINDTNPESSTPALAQSSLFGLVDYEKPTDSKAGSPSLNVSYNFEVEFLRALFINSELRQFSCQINLTINNLFDVNVNLSPGASGAAASEGNVVVITGSYQAHSTSGEDDTSGQGLYSFVAQGNFLFNFAEDNPYLKTITLTKLQFAFQQETPVSSSASGTTTNIQSSFSIWGNMVFKDLNILDIFSFEKLVFADLGIGVSFDLTVAQSSSPTTSNLQLEFSPGNLRFDLGQTTNRQSSTSLLSLIPFKLKSFLYSQKADQTIESLGYFRFSGVPGLIEVRDRFNYAMLFDLDLGSLGGLVGSLAAFKFSILIGWLSDATDEGSGIAFGVQLPQADGKLEITIQGVLSLVIEEFKLQYQTVQGNGASAEDQQIFVLALHNSYMEIFGTRVPPGNALFDFALFAPAQNAEQIGWIAAINNTGGGDQKQIGDGQNGQNGEEGGVFQLLYLGGGQRVGPDPQSPPTNFQDFLDFMTGDFWDSVKKNEYDAVYHPDGKWLIVSDFKLLGIIEAGFVFYDVTPFYSLTLNVEKYFNFEITYTKISDQIGLFYANLALPDTLRTFQVGAASLTLPSIGVSVYTNGNWKLDVGFPQGDDWSRSFRVQAQAGPVPVTGSGGFYMASLSSATTSIFKGNYPSILAFGFAARLGVGKDFTSGPLKAGISVTFFGIIEGAAGYLASGSTEIFQTPDALSLKGQFGIIGELYGSIDFKIIKASVNVRLQASIGIELLFERSIPGSGSILLYIEASVSVSVKVRIDLGLFSVSVSFSFKASFRFEWQLVGSSSASRLSLAFAVRPDALTVTNISLCSGLNSTADLWFLPELTVIFPNTTVTGTPWFVCSLGIEYDNEPPASPTYSDLKPFETVTAQLVTWALTSTGTVSACSSVITQDQLYALDQTPDVLVGWITYDSLITQLSNFTMPVTVPSGEAGTEAFATTFPMFPFLQLETEGRLNDSSQPDDLDYQFSSKNLVSQSYIQMVEDYFNQLFVNQTQNEETKSTALLDTTLPLTQEIFLDYFTGLIRGAVHELLQTMQDEDITEMALDQLICKSVGLGQFKTLAGQMSSSFRGGVRLPYVDGLTVPGGSAQTTTNPLYALLWQEFPVGNLSPVSQPNGVTAQYSILLTNPDTSNPWVTSDVNWSLTDVILSPFQNLTSSEVEQPGAPEQLPFTNTGPQSFSYENAIPWKQPNNVEVSLRQFPSNLRQLQSLTTGSISVLVESRETGAAYLPGGTPLQPGDFSWATVINLTVAQVPGTSSGAPLPDIYSLSGASQQDQALLELILTQIEVDNPIESINVLYQTEAGATGLSSSAINAQDVFVLRTNTTTVSAPPAGPTLTLELAAVPPSGVAVGAQIDEDYDFLQIIQQAAVTNASGYYLRYKDAAGNNLPTDLFTSGPAPLTLLILYKSDGKQNTDQSPAQVLPFYNTIILSNTDPTLLYYAVTTDPALETQYVAVASGSVGVELVRDDASMKLQAPAALAATSGLSAEQGHTRVDMIKALIAAGITDETEVHNTLASAGAAPAQLNALYSLITYQVEQSTGFIQSNLSAPIQPQNPDTTSDDTPDTYRVFVPLYNLATENQSLPVGVPPDRYASIDDPFNVMFFQNDAFGNQMPTQLSLSGTNLYFDSILPVSEWQSVVTAYDFLVDGKAQSRSLSVYLEPSKAAFENMTSDQASAALQLYYTIQDQMSAIVSQATNEYPAFYIETNLALQSDNSMAQVALTAEQSQQILAMIEAIVKYLQNFASSPSFNVPSVSLGVSVPEGADLPPVFEIAVLLGIQRNADLISPFLKNQQGQIIYPPAQNVSSTIAPTVGASLPDNNSVDITTFAKNFSVAFASLALSVGLNGASQPQQQSSTGQARARLKAEGLPSDGTGAGSPGPQSLWAVDRVLLDISIGTSTASGPFYLSPKPLDNRLNTAVVPLPTLPSTLTQLPVDQLFSDVDLDQLNRSFFQAVDDILAPASAAQAFEQARDAYSTIANGRKSLADKYSEFEIDWLFPDGSPFTPASSQIASQLSEAQETFAQQMRAALMTAYSVDTIVQSGVKWNSSVPASADDMIALFGQVQTASQNQQPASPLNSAGLSTAKVMIDATGASILTFLYGTPDVKDTAQVTLDLEFNVTHVEYFLAPASQTPSDEARPSIWLQLVNGYEEGLPHIGPANTETTIPLVFREYPTPPTIINQSGVAGLGLQPQPSTNNPLTSAAAWHYIYSYQSQITVHDQIVSLVTYNTDLSASTQGNSQLRAATLDEGPFTLFQALARFTAAYTVLQPILRNLADPNWATAASAFAPLVTEVINNTDWNPPTALFFKGLVRIVNSYTITDKPVDEKQQIITLTWSKEQGESSWPGATLSILALDPQTLEPYPNQTQNQIENGITDTYTPDPPLSDDWVVHQIEVDSLNVLTAENALASVQVERNVIELEVDNQTYESKSEFVYKTPLVSASQPVTPFIDNSIPIDVAQLPNQGRSAACPQSPASLCQRIYAMMFDLLSDSDQIAGLLAARASATLDESAERRVKVACSFQYPIVAAAGASSFGANPIAPLVPVVLARSFVIDGSQTDQLNDFAILYADAITQWSKSNGVLFGSESQPSGAQLIFDITLYAQLSGLNTPVLRLRNLQLNLIDIDPV